MNSEGVPETSLPGVLQACGNTLVLTSRGQGEGSSAHGSRAAILSLWAGGKEKTEKGSGWEGCGGCAVFQLEGRHGFAQGRRSYLGAEEVVKRTPKA